MVRDLEYYARAVSILRVGRPQGHLLGAGGKALDHAASFRFEPSSSSSSESDAESSSSSSSSSPPSEGGASGRSGSVAPSIGSSSPRKALLAADSMGTDGDSLGSAGEAVGVIGDVVPDDLLDMQTAPA